MKCPDSFFEKYKKVIQTDTFKENEAFLTEVATEPLIEMRKKISSKAVVDKLNSNQYKNDLINSFELFDLSESKLIEKIINQYLKAKKKSLLIYDDFLILFCSILKYYSSLNFTLKFFNSKFNIMIFVYGNETIYENLAEFFEYDLQLKPYAYMYDCEHNNKSINHELQFEDCEYESPLFFPPYSHYHNKHKDVFRLYYQDDSYCNYNDNTIPFEKKVSKFRAIDKLRLMYYILDYLLIFTHLFKRQIIFSFIYKRNNNANKSNFSDNFIQPNVLNIFNEKITKKRINFLRNYFCESVSFYFLWVDIFFKWLTIPCVLSIILCTLYYLHEEHFVNLKIEILSVGFFDFCLIIYGSIITLWASLFHKVWLQQEKMYRYFWGMDTFEKHNPLNEKFIPDTKEELIFGYYHPRQANFKHKIKKYSSFGILLLMILIVILSVFYLFCLKNSLFNKYGDDMYKMEISCFIGCLNAVQIKVMKWIYKKIAVQLNEWENHYKIQSKENSLAIKLILFDFVNHYMSLFYIAFYKPYHEGCVDHNCMNEIKTQLYILLSVFFLLNVLEIIIPIIKSRKIKEELKIIQDENNETKTVTQSIEHLLSLIKTKHMHVEYNEIIILFGFVSFFSTAAPLIAVIVFFLLFVSRFVDHYKFYHLIRVDFVNGAKGIEKYNKVLTVFIFIGAVVNVAIVLFSRGGEEETNNSFKAKWILFGILENMLILGVYSINWKIIPKWFSQLSIIKELYYKKFMFKESDLSNLNFKSTSRHL